MDIILSIPETFPWCGCQCWSWPVPRACPGLILSKYAATLNTRNTPSISGRSGWLELETNLREVSQCPGKAPIAYSVLIDTYTTLLASSSPSLSAQRRMSSWLPAPHMEEYWHCILHWNETLVWSSMPFQQALWKFGEGSLTALLKTAPGRAEGGY